MNPDRVHRRREVDGALWLRILACVILCLACAGAAIADSITLRPVVRMDAQRAALTLADIARLDGPIAQALGDVPIATIEKDAGVWVTIDVGHVREALKARPELDWSRLTIHGLSTQVRRLTPPRPAEPEPELEPTPEESPSVPTLRFAIARRLTDMLAVESDKLRLKFDDRDTTTLAMPTTRRIVDIQPLGSGDRVPLAVRVYEHEQLILNITLRVHAEVQRPVAAATGALKKGHILEAGDFTIEDRWLPATARPLAPELATGKAIRQAVNPGEAIGIEDVQPPVVVKRGELVSVHCLTEGFVLKLTCRAMSDGRDGELMQFETLEAGRKDRRVIFARPAGAGTAIAASTDAPPEKVQERALSRRQPGAAPGEPVAIEQQIGAIARE